jgi:predicted pyridoxine 5'-phosphate oxidase superfamily flavin-nucleotide-binding protein
MGILSEDMKRVVAEQRLGFVATVCPDGTANLSPKGTTAVWDDDHLMFVDIKSPGTVQNLRHNPSIEVNVVDQVARKGYRFKGTAEVHSDGPVFDQVVETRRQNGARNRVRAVVIIKVERALLITSPDYDLGTPESDIRARWRQYWRDLDAQAATDTGRAAGK